MTFDVSFNSILLSPCS